MKTTFLGSGIPARSNRAQCVIDRLPIACCVAAPFCLGNSAAVGYFGDVGGGDVIVDTTSVDYFQGGTQPNSEGVAGWVEVSSFAGCVGCHGGFEFSALDPISEPHRQWSASMMGQSARDPVFRAALTVASKDVEGGAQFCVRCHAPVAFLEGNLNPIDESTGAISFDNAQQEEGVSCQFCHRMLNPVFVAGPGGSPDVDELILESLELDGLIPNEGSNARYVVDPDDARRGPFDDIDINPHVGADIIHSTFHTSSEFCWTCHDVSNPLMVRGEGNTYVLDTLDSPHPTGNQLDMFPLHRTYSEWQNSYYDLLDGVDHPDPDEGEPGTGLYGSVTTVTFDEDLGRDVIESTTVMHVCQDCHMPDVEGFGCNLGAALFPERPNVPQHSFIGSNNWVLRAVRDLFGESESGLTEEMVDLAIERNETFLAKASKLAVEQIGPSLRTRITNRTGHKLPTGFPDGRRMWIHVQYLDAEEMLIEEFGAYDFETAELSAENTKVYEMVVGIDDDQSLVTGLPVGQTFHFMLANTVVKDNRIPPQGYSVSIAEQRQMAPVGAFYENGQHWDDTFFDIPDGAVSAVVTVYYQLTSKEFITFLRDNTEPINDTGDVAYQAWVDHGMSPPVVMDSAMIDLDPFSFSGDLDGDGSVGAADLALLLGQWGPCGDPGDCPADLDGSGAVGPSDLAILLGAWSPGR